jgi:hypothetical protein
VLSLAKERGGLVFGQLSGPGAAAVVSPEEAGKRPAAPALPRSSDVSNAADLSLFLKNRLRG